MPAFGKLDRSSSLGPLKGAPSNGGVKEWFAKRYETARASSMKHLCNKADTLASKYNEPFPKEVFRFDSAEYYFGRAHTNASVDSHPPTSNKRRLDSEDGSLRLDSPRPSLMRKKRSDSVKQREIRKEEEMRAAIFARSDEDERSGRGSVSIASLSPLTAPPQLPSHGGLEKDTSSFRPTAPQSSSLTRTSPMERTTAASEHVSMEAKARVHPHRLPPLPIKEVLADELERGETGPWSCIPQPSHHSTSEKDTLLTSTSTWVKEAKPMKNGKVAGRKVKKEKAGNKKVETRAVAAEGEMDFGGVEVDLCNGVSSLSSCFSDAATLLPTSTSPFSSVSSTSQHGSRGDEGAERARRTSTSNSSVLSEGSDLSFDFDYDSGSDVSGRDRDFDPILVKQGGGAKTFRPCPPSSRPAGKGSNGGSTSPSAMIRRKSFTREQQKNSDEHDLLDFDLV
eukprot:CAMPEP_0113918630 /NCGR_PEP_ID=MMETSP0780_2-20120614/33469_1 /TAXON_ID=652834 /ORGANISM="Palpitomonas bilix" /LENGTH=451 /DNA_ID=CAMNT_0000918481 /DNA_START=178 /DNA_END=1533 /DNA_ORIENTATION=+ /assembly_acc=CAM_ASM_000599